MSASLVDRVPWPVRTQRLSLRRATEADLDALWAIRKRPDVSRWMTSASSDRAEFVARVGAKIETCLVVEQGGLVLGDLYLAPEDAWAQSEVSADAVQVQAEIGWCLAPEYGGRGLGTEAVLKLLQISFDVLELRRVVAQCFADNAKSWRLMERVGMRREAHFVADALHRDGTWRDTFTYGLLRSEWRARGLDLD